MTLRESSLAVAHPLNLEQAIANVRQRAVSAIAGAGLSAAAFALAQILDGGLVLRVVLSLGLHILIEPWLTAQLMSLLT